MHGRDRNGAVASMLSVAKLSYDDSRDGISYTYSIVPQALGKEERERRVKLVSLLDAYFAATGHHLNVNVLERETLLDAMAVSYTHLIGSSSPAQAPEKKTTQKTPASNKQKHT